MLNHIVIQGRLVRDPELRRTGSGLAVASFSVAVERDYPDKDTGERGVDFINCVAWREKGEFVSKYFTKGSMIVVSGRLQMRKWIDNDTGANRTTYEIIAENVYFGSSKKDQESAPIMNPHTGVPYYTPAPVQPYQYNPGPFCTNGVKPAVSDFTMLDDDAQLPF